MQTPITIPQCKLALRNPEPNLLQKVSRNNLRPDLRIKRRLASPDIRLTGLDELGLLEYAPESVQREVDGDDDVGCDEALDVPVALAGFGIVGEDREAVEEDNDDEEAEREVSGPGLEARDHGFVGGGDALGDAGGAEAEEGDQDADPGEKGGYGGELRGGVSMYWAKRWWGL